MQLSVNIKKQLGDFSLDIQFETGEEIFALLGASGCGKSMTLKCIAGIERPDEGRIVLGDRVLFDSEQKIDLAPQKRRVGYMFQDYALFPNMTVRQNVAVGVAGRDAGKEKTKKRDAAESVQIASGQTAAGQTGQTGADRDAATVDELLRRFHVADLADHYPVQLSGGQKQRVAMARLMGQEPDVILLDEPFSALDSHLKWQLEQEMLETLAEAGRPTIFVSHDRDEVYHMAQTVCSMHDGQAETIQPMKEFFAAPQTRTAALLSGCKNISAVERTEEGRLRATDWGIEFDPDREIPEDIAYVGIRAHDLEPVEVGEESDVQPTEQAGASATDRKSAGNTDAPGAENILTVSDAQIQEDPFEWTVFFRAAQGAEMLQWKIAKREGEELAIPEKLAIAPHKVLLLRK